MLHVCGLPVEDVDFINCDGSVMHKLLLQAQVSDFLPHILPAVWSLLVMLYQPRMTQFTGSSKVAEILARDLHGRIKLEDAGWDWKVTTSVHYSHAP